MSLSVSITPVRALATAVAAAAVALGALLALAPAAAAHANTMRCAAVAFTPNSDDVAGEVRATRTSCGFARRFIRDSEGRPGRFYGGFRCSSRRLHDAEPLPFTRYRCISGSKVIRWKRY